MNKKKIFNVLFIIFAVLGLTGHVFGIGTSSPILPDNMTPEQKNLYNYIMAKSHCDAGEANLLIQMLCDQLTETQSGAFLLYMMNPDAPANFPGMNPESTLNDYFTNSQQYSGMKYQFDTDLERFGRMSHQERLEYCKHRDNDFMVLMTELSDSGDINKIHYVFQEGGIISEELNNQISSITDQMKKHNKNIDFPAIEEDGEKLKLILNNMGENISNAMTNYDYLKGNGSAPVINTWDNQAQNLDKVIGIIKDQNEKVVNGAAVFTSLFALIGWFLGIAAINEFFTLGAVTPLVILYAVLMAMISSGLASFLALMYQLDHTASELREIRNNLP